VVAKIARHSFDLTSPRNRKAAEMRSLWSALTAIVCGIGFSARAEEAPVGFVKALSGTATVMHPSLQLSGPTSTASSRALSKPRRGSRLSISFIFRQGRQSSNPRSRGDLGATIASAKGTPNVDISVVGHTDVTGADPYNLALSLRRERRSRRSERSERHHRDCISRSEQPPYSGAAGGPTRAAQQARRGHHPLRGDRSRHFCPSGDRPLRQPLFALDATPFLLTKCCIIPSMCYRFGTYD
jgi:hypothetical protein